MIAPISNRRSCGRGSVMGEGLLPMEEGCSNEERL